MFQLLFLALIVTTYVLGAEKASPLISGTDLITNKKITHQWGEAKKYSVVAFVSSKCPCSSSHETVIASLVREFPDFKFIAIHSNRDEKQDGAAKHFRDVSFSTPVIQDDNATLADEFKAFKTPHVYVVDKQGGIVYKGGITNSHDGPKASRNYLKEVLTELNMGRPVPFSEQRVLGCVISRRE